MSFHVQISRRATQDVRQIVLWIKSRSSKGAFRWLSAFEKSIGKLSETAKSSGQAAEAEDLGIELRQQFFKTRRGNTYRMIFVIRGDVVHVLSVRGSGQDLMQPSDFELPE